MTTNRILSHRVVLLVVGGSILILGFAGLTSSGKGKQDEDRILEKANDFNPPVEITLVKSKRGIIESDKKIRANDDWLEGLTFRVRNLSDKPITHITVEIRFLRPKDAPKGLDFIVPITYGPDPFRSAPSESVNSPAPILPGQETEITVSDTNYQTIRSLLDESKFPKSIKKVRVSIRTIGFSDGTAWTAGVIFKRDPDDPEKWVPEKKA